MIRLPCIHCGEDTTIKSRSDRECDECGEQVPMEAVENYVIEAERHGEPVEPTERGP